MVQFDVSTDQLGNVARLLQSAIQTFDTQLDNVQGSVDGIVNVTWQGEDAELFQTSFTEWHTAALALRSTLQGLAMTLQGAEGGYEQTEDALGNQFTAAGAALAPKASSGKSAGAQAVMK